MDTHASFLPKIERYLKRAKVSAAAFGFLAMNDLRFVHDVRKGRKPKPATMEKALRYIREHPPESVGNGR